jgi:hypothetical protein
MLQSARAIAWAQRELRATLAGMDTTLRTSDAANVSIHAMAPIARFKGTAHHSVGQETFRPLNMAYSPRLICGTAPGLRTNPLQGSVIVANIAPSLQLGRQEIGPGLQCTACSSDDQGT